MLDEEIKVVFVNEKTSYLIGRGEGEKKENGKCAFILFQKAK